jgi:hypothetical protein
MSNRIALGRNDVARIATLRAALSVPGAPLTVRERAAFEPMFRCDLSHVRVHTDELAAAAARSVNAAAFSVGRDILFGAGEYRPDTARGQVVLTHEIAHTLQDPRAIAPGELDALAPVTVPGQPVETGAAAATAAIVVGRSAAAAAVPDSRVRIARLVAGLLTQRDRQDPAQIVVRLTETVRTTLAADPDDRLGRVRRSLLRLDDRTRRLVFEALQAELVSSDWRHLIDVLDRPMPLGTADGDGRELPADMTVGLDQAPEEPSTVETAVPEGKAPEETSPGEDAAVTGEAKPEAAADAASGEPPGKPALHIGRPHHAPARGRAGRRAPPRALAQAGAPSLPVAVEAAPEAAEAPELPVSDEGPETAHPAEQAEEPEAARAPEDETETGAAEAPGEAVAEAQSPSLADEVTAGPPEQPEPQAEQSETTAAEPAASEERPPDVPAGVTEEPANEAAPQTEVAPGPAPAADAGPGAEEAALLAEPPVAAGGPTEDEAGVAPVAVVEGAGPEAASPALAELPSEQDDAHEDTGAAGGSGSAIPEQPEDPAPPADAGADPSAAMASVADLPPAQMQQSLGSVTQAVDRSVAADRADLAAHPPEVTPPAAPAGAAAGDKAEALQQVQPTIEKVPEGAGAAAASGPAPVGELTQPLPNIPVPHVTSNADGQVTAEDARHIAEDVSELPVSDPALNVTAGDAPTLALEGAADPARAAGQRRAVSTAMQSMADAGQQDAAQPLGEDHIVPTVPSELVRGEVPAPAAAGSGAATSVQQADAATALVARERSAQTVRAAAAGAAQQLTDARAKQQTELVQARADSQRRVDAEIAATAEAQSKERTKARSDVATSRHHWTQEQRDLVKEADQQADQQVADAQGEAERQQKDGNTEAAQHITDGNAKIADARNDAEKKARAERERAENESNSAGFFSRVASAIGSFFDSIRQAIHDAFDFARKLVQDAIAAAQRLASAVIDRVRNAIVAVIRKAGEALIAIGARVLAAFPTLREKFRRAITHLVDVAVEAVNQLANALKKAVKGLLDLLARGLTAVLNAYEAIYMAAVNAVGSAVNAAINLAKGIVTALAAFAVLIRDIARNPGQWISNFGAALMDGVKNHLWKELRAAIKEWFSAKVEAVIGVGKLILDVLRKGGIAFRRIAAMVWTAVKAMIPRAIIEFLIQRVIAMIVPAVGAIMAVIEGLQAAWATVSRIVAAFERFMAFMRAVKDGNAGPLFARAVAAAAVTVIDFTANFIMSKIAKGAKGVGNRLKGIATKLMAWLRRGARAVGRVARRVWRVIVAGVRAVGRGLRRAGQWIAHSRLGRAIRNSRVGRAVGRLYQRGVTKGRELRERFRRWRERRRQSRDLNKADRLNRAAATLEPRVIAIYRGRSTGVLLRLQLLRWRLQYGLSRLQIHREGESRLFIRAQVNPWVDFAYGIMPAGETLRQLVRTVVDRDILGHPDVVRVAGWLRQTGAADLHEVPPGVGVPAAVRMMRDDLGTAQAAGHAESVSRRFRFGGEVTTSETQFDPTDPNAFVRFPRFGDVNRSDYPGLAQDIRTIQGQIGTTDPGVAKSIRELVQRGELAGDFEHRRQYVAAAVHLMFLRESVRNPNAIATAAMTTRLVERGEQTWQQALAEYEGSERIGQRGRFPPSMEGHQRAFNELEAERAAQARGMPVVPRSAEASELARREIATMEAWLLAEMRAEGFRAFVSQGDAETFIRNRLLEFYNLRRHVLPAPGSRTAGAA